MSTTKYHGKWLHVRTGDGRLVMDEIPEEESNPMSWRANALQQYKITPLGGGRWLWEGRREKQVWICTLRRVNP